MNPKDIIETEIAKKLKANPEKASAVNAVVVMDITGDDGGQWTIDCTKPGAEVKTGGTDGANLTVTMAANDFVDMYNKTLSPQQAFFAGKVKVKGDVSLALKLGNIL